MAVVLKTAEEIAQMRIAGRLAGEVLDYIASHVKAGVTTAELDRLCHEYMVGVQRTVPAPLNYAPPGYPPFPKSICTSVNHQVCHGIPSTKVVLREGDIVGVDIGVRLGGWVGGACVTYAGGAGDFRLRGKGIKGVRSSTHGDLFCHVVIETPVNLTERQKELLREFDGVTQKHSDRHNARAKSWMDKVREFFAS